MSAVAEAVLSTRPAPFDLREAVIGMIDAHAAATAGRFVLLIGGPGCVGKSTFSLELADRLIESGMPATVLELDCYLIERAKRQQGAVGFGGYHPSAYLLDTAARDIAKLIAGQTVTVSPYDKRTSGRGAPIRVEPAPLLVVEGSMALRDPIRGFGSLAIFLDATTEVLYANRKRRELALGLTPAQIDAKFGLLTADYSRYIAPQRARADLLVEIDTDYSFRTLIRT